MNAQDTNERAATPSPSLTARGRVLDRVWGTTAPRSRTGTSPVAGEDGRGFATRPAFAPSKKTIPVTVVTAGDLVVPPGAALVTIEPESGHHHTGAECLVCATRGNVRVLLFGLLEQARLGAAPKFDTVIVDARQATDPRGVVDALIPGKLPAFGLRDHTVARSFRLTDV